MKTFEEITKLLKEEAKKSNFKESEVLGIIEKVRKRQQFFYKKFRVYTKKFLFVHKVALQLC